MKILVSCLSISLAALTVSAPTGSLSNGGALARSDAQLKPLPASAGLPWHGGPRLVYDDSFALYGQVESVNWSGYAALGAADSVTAVSGVWTVPAVTGSAGDYSAVWVGVDGYSDGTVEQLGTMQYLDTVQSGRRETTVAQYCAWVEMYPAGLVELNTSKYPVNPGDTITASVTCNGNAFTLSMASSEGWIYSETVTSATPARSSAEWIVEAPSSNTGVLPLADFGKAVFSECSATIGGVPGSISTSGTGDYEEITMVYEQKQGRKETVTVEAQPSALTTTVNGMDGFSDTWESSGPEGFGF
jgi:hypothetical protein